MAFQPRYVLYSLSPCDIPRAGQGREQLDALSDRQRGCGMWAWLLEHRAGAGSALSGGADELEKPGLQRGTKWDIKTLL